MTSLLALLLRLEWHQCPDRCYATCPECGGLQHRGHQEECELAAAIEAELATLPSEERARVAWQRNPA